VRKDRREAHEIREAVLLILGCGVFIVWAITQLASVFFARPVDPAVHMIMAAVVTGLFGGAYLSGRKTNDKDAEPE
jgi:hypothetical protein